MGELQPLQLVDAEAVIQADPQLCPRWTEMAPDGNESGGFSAHLCAAPTHLVLCVLAGSDWPQRLLCLLP
jgi:hypothetical protein